jgi:Flp pilus assembly pilin Flp
MTHPLAVAFFTARCKSAVGLLRHLSSTGSVSADRRGLTTLEYGIVATFLSILMVAAFTHIGSALTTIFTEISTSI